MGLTFKRLLLILCCMATAACSVHDTYPPALPDKHHWDNSPLIAKGSNWMQEDLCFPEVKKTPLEIPPARPVLPSFIPMPEEWDLWRKDEKTLVCTGRGKQKKCVYQGASVVGRANGKALIKATRDMMEGGQSSWVTFPWKDGALYQIETTPASPTFVIFPPGEELTVPVVVDQTQWLVKLAARGEMPEQETIVVIAPVKAGQELTGVFWMKSGLTIPYKLISVEKDGMVTVRWKDVPTGTKKADPLAIARAVHPPKINMERRHLGYRLEVKGKYEPPWIPEGVFDDGTRTFIKFPEALTYTRAPAVFGVTPAGTTALVQSYMYTRPDHPEQGAMLIIQGLWPALELKDTAGLTMRIIREPVTTTAQQQ